MGSCLSSDGSGGGGDSPSSPAKKQRKGGRRRGAPSPKHGSRRDEQLHRIPGRMFLNGASGVASLFTQQGKKGTNQDAMIVWENFGSRADTIFCGVFDGHGPFGHMVARRVRDSLPLKLSAHWEVNAGSTTPRQSSVSTPGRMDPDEAGSVHMDKGPEVSVESEEKYFEAFTTLKDSFLKAFKVMDKELKLNPHIDCFCSGTTAVTFVKQGQDLILGNIGDSRAILGTRDDNDCLTAIQLTVDLKPNLPREEERIRKCKGRVFALQDEPEVSRVWLPHNDSPGLAMARAFGDFCLKDFGLISVPEISYRRLNQRDEFIVLATDGVWDVLSNKEVVDIIISAPDRSSAARFLVESAVRAWRYKYPTSKVDDCAVVCLFLNSDAPENLSIARTGESVDSLDATEDGSTKGELSAPVNLDRSGTVRSGPEIHPDKSKAGTRDPIVGSPSTEQPTDANMSAEGEDWSALEGVSRVNTLLTLPRYVAKEKRVKGSKNPV